MYGQAIASDHMSTMAVALLDHGLFPLAHARLDELLGSWSALRHVSRWVGKPLSRYQPRYLVHKEDARLVWRPDPEYTDSGSYRQDRWIAFQPLGMLVSPHAGAYPVALVSWETGHDRQSTFCEAVTDLVRLRNCWTPLGLPNEDELNLLLEGREVPCHCDYCQQHPARHWRLDPPKTDIKSRRQG